MFLFNKERPRRNYKRQEDNIKKEIMAHALPGYFSLSRSMAFESTARVLICCTIAWKIGSRHIFHGFLVVSARLCRTATQVDAHLKPALRQTHPQNFPLFLCCNCFCTGKFNRKVMFITPSRSSFLVTRCFDVNPLYDLLETRNSLSVLHQHYYPRYDSPY